MDNTLGLIVILCAVLFLPISVMIVKFCKNYSRNVRYVKMRIEHADDWNEYVRWKMELRNLRWCILPGLTPDRVKRIRRLFYKGKHHKKKENDGLYAMMLPSVLGIAVCAVCLVTGTYAWFTASISTPAQKIQAAKYDVTVSVTHDGMAISAQNDSYMLKSGENKITLSATGNASTGYCTIVFGNSQRMYYTPPLPDANSQTPFDTFTFTVKVATDTVMSVIPHWGSYPAGESDFTVIDSTLEIDLTADGQSNKPSQPNDIPSPEEPPSVESTEKVHRVEVGEVLSVIAKEYGFTAEEFAAYNGIENVNLIYAGQELKIPPEGYRLPEKPIDSVTEQTEPTSTSQPEKAPETQDPPVEDSVDTAEPSASEVPSPSDSTDIPAGSDIDSAATMSD